MSSKIKEKNILITGITGMVGSHLLDYILDHTTWEVYGLMRWRSAITNISHQIENINGKDRIKLIEGDLLDQTSLLNCLQVSNPDIIFHLAAQSFPTASFVSPTVTYDVNTLGTSRLLDSIRILGMNPLVHICSSSEVYGRTPQEFLPIKESTPFHPASPYSISKIGTDLVSRFHFEAYGTRTLITRMFTHTGPRRGDVFAESSFAKQIAMIEHELVPPIVHTGNLDSLRTWSDVRDAVRAYFKLVTINPIPGEIYNIGGNTVKTIKEVLNFLIDQSPKKDVIKVQIDPRRVRPIDADLQVPDATKFIQHTGWKPMIPFEKTMLDLLNYWRDKVLKDPQIANR